MGSIGSPTRSEGRRQCGGIYVRHNKCPEASDTETEQQHRERLLVTKELIQAVLHAVLILGQRPIDKLNEEIAEVKDPMLDVYKRLVNRQQLWHDYEHYLGQKPIYKEPTCCCLKEALKTLWVWSNEFLTKGEEVMAHECSNSDMTTVTEAKKSLRLALAKLEDIVKLMAEIVNDPEVEPHFKPPEGEVGLEDNLPVPFIPHLNLLVAIDDMFEKHGKAAISAICNVYESE